MGAKKIYFILTAFVVSIISASILQAQTTIWFENFDYADGTSQGSGSPPKWTRDVAACSFDGDDHFEVRSNKFSINDTDGEGVWTSEIIDISGYSDVSLSVHLTETGSHEPLNDYIYVLYKLDGGIETQFETNGFYNDDWDAANASQTGLNGEDVAIVIRAKNAANDEFMYWDNILVLEGTPTISFTNGGNAALNFQQSSPTPSQDNWHLGQFSLAGDATGATLNSVTVTVAGTYDSGDLDSNPFRLRASNTNDFGAATEIGSDVADPGSGHDITFSSINDAIPNGTRYYWLTADISGSATDDDNINGTIDASGDLSITNGSLNGSSSYGKLNAGSEPVLPVVLSSFTASYENNFVILRWTTESEVGGVGFIIERRTVTSKNWQQIASYLTNNSLVCMNNPVGYTPYTFIDNKTEPDTTYFYRLSDVDIYGNFNELGVIEISSTEVIEISSRSLPQKMNLFAAYPNPFNPHTKIKYQLAEDAVVELYVHNVLGQMIRKLVAGVQQSPGNYSFCWDGLDDAGEIMPSGTYIVTIKTGESIKSVKVLLLR
jgi:hypothetical protein